MAEGTDLVRQSRSRVCGKKGEIITLYRHPPAGSRVICLDEMGPVAVKDYPAIRWSWGGQRPRFAPSYERRGKVWVYGALEPATGAVLTTSYHGRSSQEVLAFLDQVHQYWPQGTVHVIWDNLSSHKTLAVVKRQVKVPI